MIRTGEQYKDSIRDNREVYMNRERVKDVTKHPMFKPIVDVRARVFDMQHEAETAQVMTVEQNGKIMVTSIVAKLKTSAQNLCYG